MKKLSQTGTVSLVYRRLRVGYENEPYLFRGSENLQLDKSRMSNFISNLGLGAIRLVEGFVAVGNVELRHYWLDSEDGLIDPALPVKNLEFLYALGEYVNFGSPNIYQLQELALRTSFTDRLMFEQPPNNVHYYSPKPSRGTLNAALHQLADCT